MDLDDDWKEQTPKPAPVHVIPLTWEGVLQSRCVIVRGNDRDVEAMWGQIRRTEDELQKQMTDEYDARDLAFALQEAGVEIAVVERPHRMLP